MNNENRQPVVPDRQELQPIGRPDQNTAAFRPGGRVDREAADGFRAEVMLLLQELILQYTADSSSSVRVETAERILRSLLYTIEVGKQSGPETGPGRPRTRSARELYGRGLQILTACLADAKELYSEVKWKKLSVPLRTYNYTINEALPEFFLSYEVLFGAHETMANIDYPLLCDVPDLQGVFYLHRYLAQLALENEFCRCFRPEEIMRLLHNYGRIYDIDYRVSMVNICEIVVNNAVFAILAGRPPGELTLTPAQASDLSRELHALAPGELEAAVLSALAQIGTAPGGRPGLAEYLRQYAAGLVPRVRIAAASGSLDALILTEPAAEAAGPVFIGGERMDDRRFAAVCRRITESKTAAAKAAVILAEISSPEDLVDLFEADCLFGDEYTTVFRRLDATVLAVLGRVAFEAELRAGPLSLAALTAPPESGTEWQEKYLEYLRSLRGERRQAVEKMLNTVRII